MSGVKRFIRVGAACVVSLDDLVLLRLDYGFRLCDVWVRSEQMPIQVHGLSNDDMKRLCEDVAAIECSALSADGVHPPGRALNQGGTAAGKSAVAPSESDSAFSAISAVKSEGSAAR